MSACRLNGVEILYIHRIYVIAFVFLGYGYDLVGILEIAGCVIVCDKLLDLFIHLGPLLLVELSGDLVHDLVDLLVLIIDEVARGGGDVTVHYVIRRIFAGEGNDRRLEVASVICIGEPGAPVDLLDLDLDAGILKFGLKLYCCINVDQIFRRYRDLEVESAG